MHGILNLKSFYSYGGEKSADSSISTAEAMRLAKGHLQLWLRQGLFADDQHLQRSRELYDLSKAFVFTAMRPSTSKPMLSLGTMSFNGLSSPNKRNATATNNGSRDMSPEDWLRYLRVLEYQGDHVAAAELVTRLLTLLDPSQEQAQSNEPFTAQETKAKGEQFANLLFYAGCIHKALGLFERANDFFFEAIEYGPPKPLSKIEMMMIISRNLEEMQNANENGNRQGDIADTTNEEAYRMVIIAPLIHILFNITNM
jgi:tetratricopeptide (TPR) repeat protein